MQDSEILQVMLELAAEAAIEVRIARRSSDGDQMQSPSSGVCRVKDRIWVVLSSEEPASAQIDVLGSALKAHAGSLLEGRYLPPAVRLRIDPEGEAGSDRA